MTTAHKDLPALPTMMGAFVTSVSDGAGRYTMQFKFKTMDDMHRAYGEWHTFCGATLARPEPASTPVAVESETQAPITWRIGGKYNWKGQSERLVYLGRNWSGNGFWHQFEKVDKPGTVWCEVQNDDLSMFEETKGTQAAPQVQQSAASGDAGGRWVTKPNGNSHWEPASDPAQEAGRDAALEEALSAVQAELITDKIDYTGQHYNDGVRDSMEAIRALKTAPAQPAVDLVAAILALKSDNPHPDDNCGLYSIGFYAGAHAAAALARAQLEGK